jgi:hypothetical protein
VAVRANLDDQLRPVRAGGEFIAARRAADSCEHLLGVNLLQGNLLLRNGRTKSKDYSASCHIERFRPTEYSVRRRLTPRPAWTALKVLLVG